jgi:small membrane protein
VKPVQFLLLAFVLVAFISVIRSYTHRGMQRRNFLFWILVWSGTAAVITFPDATSFVAYLLGIGRGADLIIYASLLISFYLILRVHLTLSRLEQEITEIVRAIALDRLREPLDSGSRPSE